MYNSHQLGKLGENLALEFLKQNQFSVVVTNWRWQKAEIDIIAKKLDLLVFVEVKTRSSEKYGSPYEFVNTKKQKLMKEAAEAFIEQHQMTNEIRFDIISVVINSEIKKIKHIPDAF